MHIEQIHEVRLLSCIADRAQRCFNQLDIFPLANAKKSEGEESLKTLPAKPLMLELSQGALEGELIVVLISAQPAVLLFPHAQYTPRQQMLSAVSDIAAKRAAVA